MDEDAIALERPLLDERLMKRYLALFKQTWSEFGDDKAPRLGAALAYYTVFSIAPLLLIAVAIAGLVFGREAAQGQIQQQLAGVMGQSTANAVGEMINNAAKPKSGTLATIIGVATLILGAAGVFGQLQEALDTIWNVKPKKNAGILATIKDRFLSMAMVFGIGFLLLVTLIIDAAISAAGKWIGPKVPGGEAAMQTAQLLVSFGIVTLLFALMFRYLPHVRVAWHDVRFGAVFTALLFVLGKFALGLYIGKAAVGSSYGAAGSLVIILIWVYWSAQIVFFGAEFTQVYARTHGSMKGDTSKADGRGKGRLEGRVTLHDERPLPALHPSYARTSRASGGKGKLVAGGAAGLVIGTLFGGVATTIVAVKSVKKVLTLPFK